MVHTLVLVLVTLGLLQALWGLGTASILPTVTAWAHEHNSAPKVASDHCSTCLTIDNLCYNKSVLFELQPSFAHPEKVGKMGIMRSNNVLYYQFEPPYDDRENSKVGYVYLENTTSYGVIEKDSIRFNFSTFDIDQNKSTIYLGGSDGIWCCKDDLPYPQYFVANRSVVTKVIFKDYVYFTTKDSQGIREYYESGNDSKIRYTLLKDKKIEDFVVMVPNRTGYYHIVIYLNGTGMYAYHERIQESVKLSDQRHVKGFTVDAKGTAYAWRVDGIHKVIIDDYFPNSNLTRVSPKDFTPDSLAFDKYNDIVFTSGKKLQKLSIINPSYCTGSIN